MYWKETYYTALKTNVCRVTFIRQSDFQERVLVGTLEEDVLPRHQPCTAKSFESVMPIYDLEKNDWRSFHVNTVSKFEVLNDDTGVFREI